MKLVYEKETLHSIVFYINKIDIHMNTIIVVFVCFLFWLPICCCCCCFVYLNHRIYSWAEQSLYIIEQVTPQKIIECIRRCICFNCLRFMLLKHSSLLFALQLLQFMWKQTYNLCIKLISNIGNYSWFRLFHGINANFWTWRTKNNS